MDKDQILTRIQWRQLENEESEPTDAGVVSTSRLLRYITPQHTRKKDGDDYIIRTEWLGHQSTKSGSDTFRIEHQNLEEIAQMVVENAREHAIIRNLGENESL